MSGLTEQQRADIDRLLDDDWRVVLQAVARREFEDGIMPGMDDHRRVSECVADTLEAAAAALRQSPSVEEVAELRASAMRAAEVIENLSGCDEVSDALSLNITPEPRKVTLLHWREALSAIADDLRARASNQGRGK